MGMIEPTKKDLDKIVAQYLPADAPPYLGIAIGYASSDFSPNGKLYFHGEVQNQLGAALTLDGEVPFEIASVSKTFTATLYALLIRSSSPNKTIGDYSLLPSNSPLSPILLDELMNYTSGLPADNVADPQDTPNYLPQPYSPAAMLSYLANSPPNIVQTGVAYTYSNLGYAIMASILALQQSGGEAFQSLIQEKIFQPLGMKGATYFDKASLETLPLGFQYDYGPTKYYPTAPGWGLFPAYFGAGGIVATPHAMLKWLLFNMGLTTNSALSPLIPVLQTPTTNVLDPWGDQLCLGWFLNKQYSANGTLWSASLYKDGDLDGFGSYIAFLPSADPGGTASQAGVFVLVNVGGLNYPADNSGTEIACVLANDILLFMQGLPAPANKSVYPRSLRGPRRKSG